MGVGNGIGEILRFQAQGTTAVIPRSVFTRPFCQKIGRVDLDSRLVGAYSHGNACHISCQLRCGISRSQNKVMIIATPIAYLVMGVFDISADGLLLPEIKRGVIHGKEPSCCQTMRIALCDLVRIDFQKMPQYRSTAVLIEISVVGKIQNGVLMGKRMVRDRKPIVLRQPVGHRHIQPTRILFLAIRAEPVE